MNLKAIRIAAWAAVAACVVGVAVLAMLPREDPRVARMAAARIGGPFSLTDQFGQTVTYGDLKGQKSAIFFGYTHCPDVCPTTLYEAGLWLEALGDAADALHVYFVTIDPERDTPEMLADYLRAFDPRIRALTGSREAIDQAIENFRVIAVKVETDDPEFYLMDHTASVFLLDDDASLVSTVDFQDDMDIAMGKIRKLLEG